MNLAKIAEAKTALEKMMDKVYDLQEALLLDDKMKIAVINETYRTHVYELYLVLIRTSNPEITFEKQVDNVDVTVLLQKIEESTGITKDELYKNRKSRIREYVLPRQLYMALAIKTFQLSQYEAGEFFEKDHATARNAIVVIKNLWQTNKIFRNKYRMVFEYCFEYDKKNNRNKTIDYLNEK